MYRKAHPLFLICNTPTHVGSGSELGVVDLPIQRERHTGFPKFESSSLKGSLREAFERGNSDELTIHRVFGYDGDAASNKVNEKIPEKERQFAGAIGFTDARLLLFPVKSMKGVFAWITCLRVLKQFQSDMQLVKSNFQITNLDESHIRPDETYLFATDSNVKIQGRDKVLLEEYAFDVANELNGVLQIDGINFPDWLAQHLYGDNRSYWSEKIKRDIIVLPDDDFKDFVNLSTEVVTRTKIDNTTGTVAQGALFNEEYLPTDSILYSLFLAAPEFKKDGLKAEEVSKFFKENLPLIVQIGANATLGKGIITTKLVEL
jgi:CRISPR-associated protein Cmr4